MSSVVSVNTFAFPPVFQIRFLDSGSVSSILVWIPLRIQGFDEQKLEKFTVEKKYFFDKKLQITYP